MMGTCDVCTVRRKCWASGVWVQCDPKLVSGVTGIINSDKCSEYISKQDYK